jgi:hypothetical protein
MAVPAKAPVLKPSPELLACVRAAYRLGYWIATDEYAWQEGFEIDVERLGECVRDVERCCGIPLPESRRYLESLKRAVEEEKVSEVDDLLGEFETYLEESWEKIQRFR